MITELRRYRIKPGRMDAWLAVFEGALAKNLEHGMRVEYAGIDRETNSVVWLRSFADERDRVARKGAFYGSDVVAGARGRDDGSRPRVRGDVPRGVARP